MEVGLVTRSLANHTPEETVDLLKKFGFTSTEISFAFSNLYVYQYNGYKPMDELTDEAAKDIIKLFRDNSIDVVAIGAFSSLCEPDKEKQENNFKAYERYIQVAANNGIEYVATESGFVPGKRGIDFFTFEADFAYFKSNMIRLLDIAKHYGVSIAYEPCIFDFAPSAKRTRDLIWQCERDNFKILLDPANLIANSDEEDIFKYLKDYIAYFHGKDRKVNDAKGRNVGEGDIDWVKFLSLRKKYTPDAAFILEYCNKTNCEMVKERVLEYAKQVV